MRLCRKRYSWNRISSSFISSLKIYQFLHEIQFFPSFSLEMSFFVEGGMLESRILVYYQWASSTISYSLLSGCCSLNEWHSSDHKCAKKKPHCHLVNVQRNESFSAEQHWSPICYRFVASCLRIRCEPSGVVIADSWSYEFRVLRWRGFEELSWPDLTRPKWQM